jgi:hypothetical protein
MHDDTPLRGTGPRLITATEFAAVLKVTEQDVLDWIAEGRLPSEPGADGAPRLRIIDEAHEDGGATRAGFVMYSSGSLTREEIRTRRRERELESYGYDGPIDVDALTEALALRLAAVVPDPRDATADMGMLYGTDVALCVAAGEADAPEELVRSTVERVMASTSDHLADDTTEPWPARAGQFDGGFAPIGTEIAEGRLRMWWGDAAAPILELEPLPLEQVLIR